MKLMDKVVLTVLAVILITYVIFKTSDDSSSQKSPRVPLFKDSIRWKVQQDAIYQKAVQSFMDVDVADKKSKKTQKSSIVRWKPQQDSLMSDKLLTDGLLISFSKSKLQINVIEENEKAFVYWSTMARAKAGIKATGNTLIVFSSFLDLSMPKYFDHVPFHRLPKNDKEMLNMLQSQGSYVMSSILTGMVNRIILVWPVWAQKSSYHSYSRKRLSFGMTKSSRVVNFCKCELNKCNVFGSHIKLWSSLCHSKMNVVIDRVKETTFYKKLMEDNWLPSTENVLLHFDATYFGSVSQTPLLMKAMSDGLAVRKLDNLSKQLFCPHSLQDETYLDRLLLKSIEYSKIRRECLRGHNAKIKSGPFANCTGVRGENFKMEEEIFKFLRRKLEGTQYLCKKYSIYVDFLLKELSQTLGRRSIKELDTLKVTGFCLSTTVKQPHNFGLCRGGYTSPRRTHIPSSKDLKLRLEFLRLSLQKISSKSVKSVDFCRNLRHGNAPRFSLSRIEATLLKYLKSSFPNSYINYDRHTLGHKTGWFNRSYLKDTL